MNVQKGGTTLISEDYGWAKRVEELAERVLAFRPVFVRITGDLPSAVMLSQLVYWHLPSKETGRSKLRVKKKGRMWVAKSHTAWAEEAALTTKQVKRAKKHLESLGLVECGTFRFDGSPTSHYWLNRQTLIERLKDLGLDDRVEEMEEANVTCETFGQDRLGPNEGDETGHSLTETTATTTPEDGPSASVVDALIEIAVERSYRMMPPNKQEERDLSYLADQRGEDEVTACFRVWLRSEKKGNDKRFNYFLNAMKDPRQEEYLVDHSWDYRQRPPRIVECPVCQAQAQAAWGQSEATCPTCGFRGSVDFPHDAQVYVLDHQLELRPQGHISEAWEQWLVSNDCRYLTEQEKARYEERRRMEREEAIRILQERRKEWESKKQVSEEVSV